jgi:hypothetical protein
VQMTKILRSNAVTRHGGIPRENLIKILTTTV